MSIKICYRFFCVIIFQFSVTASFSQQSIIKKKDFYIALSPLSLIDYADGSSFRITAEKKLSQDISLSAELGFYTALGNFFSYKQDPKGFLLKPCVKYYFKNVGDFDDFYIGLEYQYKKQSYSLEDSISLSGSNVFDKHYTMKRNINCISVKVGSFEQLRGRFIMEWFAGLGIRFFNSTTNLPQLEYDGILRGEDYHNNTGAGYQARKTGNYIYPNITIGIKLGFRF